MNNTPFDLEIIHEDDSCLIINKPAGLVINDSHTQKSNVTLQSLLSSRYPDLYTSEKPEDQEFVLRRGIIHRLDKDTSGILVLAKTPEFFRETQAQFKSRVVSKEYVAIVYADKVPEVSEFVVDAPIGRNPKNRFKFCVNAEDGREAVTEFKIEEFLGSYIDDKFLLVRAFPKTGRTHQIRVHLSAINCPVAGDEVYSGKKRVIKYADVFPRQMLHAEKIEFVHSVTGKSMSFQAVIPNDMARVIDKLKSK